MSSSIKSEYFKNNGKYFVKINDSKIYEITKSEYEKYSWFDVIYLGEFDDSDDPWNESETFD